MSMYYDLGQIKELYSAMEERHNTGRKRLGRALTLTEKILFSHMKDPLNQELDKGKSTAYFYPDRVALQDATAQMAILQFILTNKKTVAVPTSVHCDHLIRAKEGVDLDLPTSINVNKEVYDFLRSASNKYGMGFWKPGAGIIHQVVLEKYAFPGAMIIGTDSHTPNGGGLGMLAIGVGGADASEVMSGMAWSVNYPTLIGVRLTGSLKGWTSAKDVILKLAGILTTAGGTGAIVEYFGPGTHSISGTGKATITNMGAEIGATTSVFPYDERSEAYLRATERGDIADLANQYRAGLVADPEVLANPEKYYDQIVEIDLDTLEPHLVGPFTPDLAHPMSKMAADVDSENYPEQVKVALIGSCTNSSYEDMGRASHIAQQAMEAGLTLKSGLLVTPGSHQIHDTIQRDGQLESLQKAGAVVLANACGPCIGQWDRTDIKKGERNSIVTSFNRNFTARNDGNAETYAFIGSPEVVTALAFAGTLKFDPVNDSLPLPNGGTFRFKPPVAPELPSLGFIAKDQGYGAPAEDGSKVEIVVDPKSDRIELLDPFDAWDKKDFIELPIVMKASGKCTTDHICPAGPWLKYRGHLDNISDNFCEGVNNIFAKEKGHGLNVLVENPQPQKLNVVARAYKAAGLGFVMVGDQNYGEGSSREHAAMCPRHLGAKVVIARSFARIAETNLKKQGILPLVFENEKDYDKIKDYKDRISVLGLTELAPGSKVQAKVHHADGSTESFVLVHSLDDEQIEWLQAGSALNVLRNAQK